MGFEKFEINQLQALLKRCSGGEKLAQEHLFKVYYGYVIGIALRYSADKQYAEEIACDSFLKIFRNIGFHQTDKSFKAWIRKITVNASIDYYRKIKWQKNETSVEKIDQEYENNHILEKINAEEIISYLSQLPATYRYIFNLFEIEGFSHEEIAVKLNISAGTSRSGLTRAKKMLRELICKNSMP